MDLLSLTATSLGLLFALIDVNSANAYLEPGGMGRLRPEYDPRLPLDGSKDDGGGGGGGAASMRMVNQPDETSDALATSLLCVGVLLLWFRNLRIGLVYPNFGPFVQMIFTMLCA